MRDILNAHLLKKGQNLQKYGSFPTGDDPAKQSVKADEFRADLQGKACDFLFEQLQDALREQEYIELQPPGKHLRAHHSGEFGSLGELHPAGAEAQDREPPCEIEVE